MSKAFTTENDDSLEEDIQTPDPAPGEKNYITPGGFKRLQEEHKHLRFTERPEVTRVVQWAAGNGDRSENGDYLYGKKKLREIDRRLHYLSKQLKNAEVIDPLLVKKTTAVQFGATVTVRDEDDKEKTYSIVGVDEIDVAKGKISWMSPLARALVKGKEGDWITFRFPKGEQQLEITKVVYREIG